MRIKLFLHVFILEFTQTRFKKKTRNYGLWNFYLHLNFNLIGTLKLNIFYFQLPKSGEESSKRSQDSLLDGQPKSLVLHKRSLAESTANDYVIDVIKAHDPNQHGINYYLESVEPIFESNSSRAESTIKLSLLKQEKTLNSDLFKLGKEDGVLKAAQVRSAYMADAYKLNIRAASTLNDSLSAQMSVYVAVNSEQDSLFDAHFFNVSINENSPSNLLVFNLRQRLKAPNYDRKLEYKLNEKYSTPELIYSKWFKLDELSGQVLTNTGAEANIDYEKHKQVLLSVYREHYR